MRRLIGTELAGLGRRLMGEFDAVTASLSPDLQAALARLCEAETAARVRRGADAMRVNGYL
jgi:hypothetical protein